MTNKPMTDDTLRTIANNLALRAEFHRGNTHDPHDLSLASMSILTEVSNSITETLKGIPEDVVSDFLWEWLEENAWKNHLHFDATIHPDNAGDKRWRIMVTDDHGKEQWHYGATFRDAVEAAATS